MIPQSNTTQCSYSSWLKTAIYTFAFLLFAGTLSAQSAPCPADAGTLKKTSICFSDNQTILKAAQRGDALVPPGYQTVFLLTHGTQQVIQQIANEAVFALPASDSLQGIYTIHTLVYDPLTLNLGNVVLGTTILSQVNDLLPQGGGTICAALDLEGAQAAFDACDNPCQATAGRLVANTTACLPSSGEVQISATIQSAPIIPARFERLYALVNQPTGEIIRFGNAPSFTVMIEGDFAIHTLVYDATTLDLDLLFNEGIATINNIDTLLMQGGGTICGALDMTGAGFRVEACPEPCQVSAGTLVANVNPCLSDSTVVIRAVANDAPVVPTGHQVRYLLSVDTNQVVNQISETPSFTVSDTGVYTIRTMVYDPNLFAVDSLALGTVQIAAISSALDSLCGDVDLNGAVFNVKACPPVVCSAKTGILIASDSTCFYNGKAELAPSVAVAPLVPFGFDAVYLLTSGDSLIVEQVSAFPDFEVLQTGRFVIHTLVVDTTAFKIDSIQIGETTIPALNDLLLQRGGTICGALDTNGLVYEVEDCINCAANAGRLASNTDPCLEDGTATLTVYNVESPVVPGGFKLAYLLTNGNKVIEQVSDSAIFVVDTMGAFTIHTLVYDFALFDVNTIEPNVTTINSLNSQFIQGGGTMCGALDVKGFSFFIIPCPIVCDADAGTLQPASESCLQNNSATFEATAKKAPIVPEGFEVRYLLSQGDFKLIRQISATPSFTVTSEGDFTVHTFVYDPSEFDINDIKPNLTSVGDVASWLFPNGDFCGDVDQSGATFRVRDCGDSCGLTSGELGALNRNICISNGNATLSAFVIDQPFVLSGYKVKYLLAYGTNLIIQQTSDNPVFRVNLTGRFTIHTLVYNPNTFNVSAPVIGTTSIYDIHQLLLQGGGTICGSLDVTGLAYQVNTCIGDDTDASALKAYPNPSTQKVNLVLPRMEEVNHITIELINSNGDLTQQIKLEGYTPNYNLDISTVNPGVYYVRVLYDDNFIQQTTVIRAQ